MENLEIWKDIDGYEGLYQVSNLGRVKSLNYKRTGKEKILKAGKNSDGYLQVGLHKQGEEKKYLVHRLVAQAFIPNPNNLPQVNHINEDKTDNRVEEQYTNLEWINNFDNCNHGTRNVRISKANINGKISKKVKQYSLEGEFIKEFQSTMEVERQLGFSNGNISSCCSGRYKQAYGFIWKYA